MINIKTLDLQNFLFENKSSRVDLLKHKNTSSDKIKISIYRNHSFELVENTIHAYLDFANIKADFTYSDYDDSLSFFDLDKSSDALILWIDFQRYNSPDVKGFVSQRIEYLKTIYHKPILFIPFGETFESKDPQVIIYSIKSLEESLGDKFIDTRLESFSGTKLSHASCLEISKNLGLNYIPAITRPTLKAIVVDLDNTLYSGVLGEDGAENIKLSEAHKNLQKQLKKLSQEGFLLCISSKNDERDVINLFKTREDFSLKLEDFTKICASWNSKADSIAEIAAFLNIGVDSILFIDDNLGEIASVLDRHNGIKIILAKEDANITLNVLKNFPNLLKLHQQKEDSIRKSDIIANEARQSLQNKLSKEDFIKNLEVEIVFNFNDIEHIQRISELANKTNQFIFSYKRYSITEVEKLIKNPNASLLTISLKDKFSDSGIIGVCVVIKQSDEEGIVDEFFVSCRALGRGMDEIIVLGSIKESIKKLNIKKLVLNFVTGERNLPAQNFVNKFMPTLLNGHDTINYKIPENLIKLAIKS
jgi:FkbH-like protein